MDRRPPLAVSPRRLRPRPNRAAAVAGRRPPLASSVQTTPVSIKKSQTQMRSSICVLPPSSRLEPSPRTKLDFAAAPLPAWAAGKENLQADDEVALNFAAAPTLARAAGQENLHADDEVALNLAATAAAMSGWDAAAPTSPLFQRGRLYDLYSARRNERLKRKHGLPAGEEAEAMAEDPCVAVELSKRRVAKKSVDYMRRSMPATDFSASRAGGLNLRSSLRSSKEMKKASAAAAPVKSSAVKERRSIVRPSVRRI